MEAGIGTGKYAGRAAGAAGAAGCSSTSCASVGWSFGTLACELPIGVGAADSTGCGWPADPFCVDSVSDGAAVGFLLDVQ